MPWKDPKSAAEYRKRNQEKIARRARERYAENPHARRAGNKASLFKAKYGITLEEKELILVRQGGKCAICGIENAPTAVGWHLDHCHTTKVVRGVLCQPCNVMLGNAKDDEAILMSAIEYLRKFK